MINLFNKYNYLSEKSVFFYILFYIKLYNLEKKMFFSRNNRWLNKKSLKFKIQSIE